VGARSRPDWNPAAAWGAPTLATEALSRQLPPGEEGDRGAWGSCSAGYQFFIADLLQQAELKAAQGPEGPKVAHDPAHVGPPRVHESQRGCTISDSRAEILLKDQESCSSMRACRPRWLTRDNARAALSNALTNSRQIQHPPDPPPARRRFVHDPDTWDADAEWDLAFPNLAYGTPSAEALQVGGAP
jgi:hypothetical protein